MNQAQWTGDYAGEGVSALRITLNNFGPQPVAVRVNLFGAGGTFASANEVVLAPASGWITAAFAIDEASLTQTQGTGTLAQTLASVTRLLLRHDPDPLSDPGQINPVSATLGIDDITAVPEPASGLLAALGLAALAGPRQRSRGRRRA
jgi:hypothetical protein